MRWADSGAGSIKSGGGTRRAAKMVILDADHPDILEFVRSKAHEEQKAYALGEMGYDLGLNGDAWRSIQFQNANNSVRLTDDFFRRVERASRGRPKTVAGGETADEMPGGRPAARDLRGRLGLRRPGRPVRGHHPALAHQPQRRAHLGLQPVQGVHAHRRLGLQPGVDQPHGVPRRRRRVRGRRLPPRRARDAHRAGDHRHAGQLPDQADRRQRARLPPARAGLHEPRLAADVPGPRVRLRRGPRVGRGDHGAAAGRGLRAVGAHGRPRRRLRRLRGRPRGAGPGGADAPRRGPRPAGRGRRASATPRCAPPPPRPSTTPSRSASRRAASGRRATATPRSA